MAIGFTLVKPKKAKAKVNLNRFNLCSRCICTMIIIIIDQFEIISQMIPFPENCMCTRDNEHEGIKSINDTRHWYSFFLLSVLFYRPIEIASISKTEHFIDLLTIPKNVFIPIAYMKKKKPIQLQKSISHSILNGTRYVCAIVQQSRKSTKNTCRTWNDTFFINMAIVCCVSMRI